MIGVGGLAGETAGGLLCEGKAMPNGRAKVVRAGCVVGSPEHDAKLF